MAEVFTTPGALELHMEQIAIRDRRIAELEAALDMFVCPNCNNAGSYTVEHRDSDGEFQGVENVQCECQALKPHSALDALLAQAKREALEAAAVSVNDEFETGHLVADWLRQMAREVKP